MSAFADPLYPNILERIAARPARAATKLVAIDGRGGAGKTHLARQLMALDPSIKRLPIDHFPCRSDEHPFHPSGVQTRISTARVLMTLLPLTDNVPGRYQQSPWWHSAPNGSVLEIQPGGTVLLDGCYSLLREIRPLLDFAIWIECHPELAIARAIAREEADPESRAAWIQGHVPAQERYIAAQRPSEFADLILVSEADGRLHHGAR